MIFRCPGPSALLPEFDGKHGLENQEQCKHAANGTDAPWDRRQSWMESLNRGIAVMHRARNVHPESGSALTKYLLASPVSEGSWHQCSLSQVLATRRVNLKVFSPAELVPYAGSAVRPPVSRGLLLGLDGSGTDVKIS